MTLNSSGKDFGAPALKYIKRVRYETRLKRPIDKEVNALPLTWGNLNEKRVYEMLPYKYVFCHKKRLVHPKLNRWTGAPDLTSEKTVSDIKCPISLEVFCDKIEALQKGLKEYKKEFPEDYWQHISNSILLNENGIDIDSLEAIIYMPYESELSDISLFASNQEGDYSKVNFAKDGELPYILDGGHYKNINHFTFEIPKEDCDLMTETITKAIERL